nr:MAG TPA: hypothetical protein [Caudoviricetes sp.]DAO07815.1 MAG TPA: hypothetical protein [Caudoviricetes sp.]
MCLWTWDVHDGSNPSFSIIHLDLRCLLAGGL